MFAEPVSCRPVSSSFEPCRASSSPSTHKLPGERLAELPSELPGETKKWEPATRGRGVLVSSVRDTLASAAPHCLPQQGAVLVCAGMGYTGFELRQDLRWGLPV